MTTVSIVTTCLNAAATIRDTVESIISQNGPFQIQLIVTDGGSQDGTVEILQEYGNALRLIRVPGLNQTEGINVGLKAATGDIVAFLNADDVYHEGAVGKTVEALLSHPEHNWLIGWCKIINDQGREIHSWITAYKNFLLRHYSYPLLLTENFICQPAVFLRRNIIEKYGLFDEAQNYAMDYEYWLRIAQSEQPLILKEYLASFRRSKGTKSNSGYFQQAEEARGLARGYAVRSGFRWTIPINYMNYLKRVGLYTILYR